VTFTQFGKPVIDEKGRVAFWAMFQGTGARGNGGLYVWDPNLGVQRVLDDDPNTAGIVPGLSNPAYFGRYTDPNVALNRELVWAGGDRLLFISNVSRGTAEVMRGIYRWRATDATFVRVVDIDALAALFSNAAPGAFAPQFYLPGVSDSGQAIFGATYVYFTRPPNSQAVTGQGVFWSNGTTVAAIADSVLSRQSPGTVPGQGSTAYFDEPDVLTTLSGGGDMLFQSYYASGAGAVGLYLRRDATNYRVIDNRSGASWPGLPLGARVEPGDDLFAGFAVGPAGHIAVETTLSVGGTVRETVLVWDYAVSAWTEVTGFNGTPATDLVTGVNEDGQFVILAGGIPYLVSRTERIQLNMTPPAELYGVPITWSDSVGSINNHGRAVLGYTRGSSLGLVFWTGQQLLLVADPVAGAPPSTIGITTIEDVRRDRVGRSGMLNDRDEIVFRAARTGGTEAIYLARAQ